MLRADYLRVGKGFLKGDSKRKPKGLVERGWGGRSLRGKWPPLKI